MDSLISSPSSHHILDFSWLSPTPMTPTMPMAIPEYTIALVHITIPPVLRGLSASTFRPKLPQVEGAAAYRLARKVEASPRRRTRRTLLIHCHYRGTGDAP